MRNFILLNIFIILASSIYLNEVILTEDVFFYSLESQLSNDQIESIVGMAKQMAWLDYCLSVIAYLLKIIVIASLVYLILYLNEIEAQYSEILTMVSKSFTIFLVPVVIRIIILSFLSHPSLEDINFFSVGSLLDVFPAAELENWQKVLLKSINIWEVIFMALLALQLKKYFDDNFQKSMRNVLVSYGSGLLVWTCFLVFITITFTPY